MSHVSAPLYQLKAEFFKTLAHPARIRVLELLSEQEHSVGEMLPADGGDCEEVLARFAGAGIGVLLMNEPTRGIDVGARAEIYRIMRELF